MYRERENREARVKRDQGPANIELMPNLVHEFFLIPVPCNARIRPHECERITGTSGGVEDQSGSQGLLSHSRMCATTAIAT